MSEHREGMVGVRVSYREMRDQQETWDSYGAQDDEQVYLIEQITVRPKAGSFSELEELAKNVGTAIAHSLAPDEHSDPTEPVEQLESFDRKLLEQYAVQTIMTPYTGPTTVRAQVSAARIVIQSTYEGRIEPIRLRMTERRVLAEALQNECSAYVKLDKTGST